MSIKDKSKPEEIKQDTEMQNQQIDQYVFDMSDFSPKGLAKIAKVNGLAVVGESGTAEAKATNGVAIAGDKGTAHCGQWGFAYAGEEGNAIAGHNSVAYARKGGVAEGSDGAIAIVLQNKGGKEKAKTRSNGVAFCGVGGIVEAHEKSIAIGFNKTKAKAAEGSIIILRYDLSVDPNEYHDLHFHIGIVGESEVKVKQGLKPNTTYKLDGNGDFVEV